VSSLPAGAGCGASAAQLELRLHRDEQLVVVHGFSM
jgi:hypothetical protein